jgi:hypothetical protein
MESVAVGGRAREEPLAKGARILVAPLIQTLKSLPDIPARRPIAAARLFERTSHAAIREARPSALRNDEPKWPAVLASA